MHRQTNIDKTGRQTQRDKEKDRETGAKPETYRYTFTKKQTVSQTR